MQDVERFRRFFRLGPARPGLNEVLNRFIGLEAGDPLEFSYENFAEHIVNNGGHISDADVELLEQFHERDMTQYQATALFGWVARHASERQREYHSDSTYTGTVLLNMITTLPPRTAANVMSSALHPRYSAPVSEGQTNSPLLDPLKGTNIHGYAARVLALMEPEQRTNLFAAMGDHYGGPDGRAHTAYRYLCSRVNGYLDPLNPATQLNAHYRTAPGPTPDVQAMAQEFRQQLPQLKPLRAD